MGDEKKPLLKRDDEHEGLRDSKTAQSLSEVVEDLKVTVHELRVLIERINRGVDAMAR